MKTTDELLARLHEIAEQARPEVTSIRARIPPEFHQEVLDRWDSPKGLQLEIIDENEYIDGSEGMAALWETMDISDQLNPEYLPRTHYAADLVQRFLPEPCTVIEVGSGYGLLTLELRARGYTVFPVDINPVVLRYGGMCLDASIHIPGNAEMIVSVACVEHFPHVRAEQAIRSMRAKCHQLLLISDTTSFSGIHNRVDLVGILGPPAFEEPAPLMGKHYVTRLWT